ncbi:MAG: metal-dependent hydrolase [Acidobacteriaceae bacterium]
MEPVTHFLTGACLGRSGFNRTTAYATLAMVLAAEAPDIDLLWGLRGPVAEFQHHRGITHTFLGAPFMALLITGVVWLWHRWRMRGTDKQARHMADSQSSHLNHPPPVRWGWIWLLALIADLSHLLLDWTNNYGLRPFFPFNPHWYAGSIFFIFEPIYFAGLLLALLMPAILGLADREIGVRRTTFRGRGWAIFALAVGVVLGVWRWAEHDRALDLLAQQNFQNEPVLKMTVNPYPGDVFQWFGVAETKDFYQTGILNTRTDSFASEAPDNLYYNQPQTPAILAAERSWLGQAFLDWSKYPFVAQRGSFDTLQDGGHYTQVHFEDLRFAYDILFLHGRRDNPLGGTVTIAPNGEVDEMRMNGHVQK